MMLGCQNSNEEDSYIHFKWNINQGTENTLVLGIDIAKLIHYTCFVDVRGRIIEKAFAVHQD